MKDLKLFSIEEMSVLESLDVKGGIAELATTQTGCPNYVPGCACTVVVVPPPVQQPSSPPTPPGNV